MHLPDRVQAVIDSLKNVDESEHFIVSFLLRDPAPRTAGVGHGAAGVRDDHLIECYRQALEQLYETLIAAPFSWTRPRTDGSRKIAVYVVYLPSVMNTTEPYSTFDRDGIPYIVLSCSHSEPRPENALERARVEAIHEAAHVFCWSARPPLRSLVERRWLWFNEATASFLEGFVCPDANEPLRFGLHWANRPEISLDRDDAQYEAGFFVRYLADRFGPALISMLWCGSTSNEGPLDALNRLLPPEIASRTSDACPVFGEYAEACFSPRRAFENRFWRELDERFGDRALSEAFVLGPGITVRTETARLDHLACRYYRIDVDAAVTCLDVKVFVDSTSGDSFRCFVSFHGDQRTVREVTSVGGRSSQEQHRRTLRMRLSGDDLAQSRQAILTVANCGTRSGRYSAADDTHDDEKAFEIEIAAR